MRLQTCQNNAKLMAVLLNKFPLRDMNCKYSTLRPFNSLSIFDCRIRPFTKLAMLFLTYGVPCVYPMLRLHHLCTMPSRLNVNKWLRRKAEYILQAERWGMSQGPGPWVSKWEYRTSSLGRVYTTICCIWPSNTVVESVFYAYFHVAN